MTTYTNQTLAEQYLCLLGKMGRVSSQHERYAARIRDAEVDIQEHYNDCGGLGRLQIKGVGRDAMKTLDLLLQKGNHGAIRTLQDMQKSRYSARLEAQL